MFPRAETTVQPPAPGAEYASLVRRTAARLLPFAIGLLLGLLLVARPPWLREWGWVGTVAVVSVVIAMLVAFVALLVAANLPADVELTPRPGATLTPAVGALAERYLALGFESAGPPMEVGISPPGVMVPFVHREARTYGTVFRTGTLPEKTAFDFFSYLEGERGGLTSSAEVAGATLPAGPGDLRQVFPGAPPDEVFRRHREALAYLRGCGLPCRGVDSGRFTADFKAAIVRHRRNFLVSPVCGALIAIGRTASRTTPHVGPLASQKVGRRQIQALLSRPTSSGSPQGGGDGGDGVRTSG